MTTSQETQSEVDLSDLPEGMAPELVAEIASARRKRIETESRKLSAEAELRHQKTLGARYKEWALNDSIGQELAGAFVPRGRVV